MFASHRPGDLDRRSFLRATGTALAGLSTSPLLGPIGRLRAAEARPKVAAVMTEFRFRGHAHVLLENFLGPYLFNGEPTDPGVDVVSFYVDETPPDDMARGVAREYGIPIFPTIEEALCLGGGKLAVDAVLAIGEHGRYPLNHKGQVEYPRKRFFDEIADVCESNGSGVPVFNDKHLSYRGDWAEEMYLRAKQLGIPLMAGSSVPLAQRRPPLEIEPGSPLRQAVSIHGGPVESYDFHGLEVLQSLVEARRGGETGIARVRFLDEDDLWKAAEDGLWSTQLADAAMRAELGDGLPPFRELISSRRLGGVPSHGILLDYLDGFRAIVVTAGSSGTRWNFACEIEGESLPRATSFYVGPWNNRNLFKGLAHAIQAFFRNGVAPYPVERTLLTTVVLDAAMDSRFDGGTTVERPSLHVSYQPRDFSSMREMGKTWEILTEDTPEPRGIHKLKP